MYVDAPAPVNVIITIIYNQTIKTNYEGLVGLRIKWLESWNVIIIKYK